MNKGYRNTKIQKARIIEVRCIDKSIHYIIQQPLWILFLFTWGYGLLNKPIPEWFWTYARFNMYNDSPSDDKFSTLEIAKENLCYFDGSESSYKVVK